jgi:hypothetical protein
MPLADTLGVQPPTQKRSEAHANYSGRESRDARRRERLKVSLPLHVRPFDARYADIEDVGQVIDFTRDGLFFRTCMPHYYVGMRLIVTFPYGDKVSAHRRMLATVIRVEHFEGGSRGVAVRVLL